VIPRLEERLTGAYAAIPIPFHDDQSLDLDGLGEIIDRVLARGIRGLTILGDSAESMTLSDDERYGVLGYAVQRTGGRATIVAGLRSSAAGIAVEQGKRFKDLGADALLVALPGRPGALLTGVVAHYTAVVRDVDLPTLYDHAPTDLALSPEEVGELLTEVTLVGIRNGSRGAADLAEQIRAVGRPISMFTGQSFDCLTCLAGGGVGAICPIAALMPSTARRLIDEHRAGNDAGAEDAQSRLLRAAPLVTAELHEATAGVPHPGIREALVSVGILRSAMVRGTSAAHMSEERRQQMRVLGAELAEL